MKNNKRSIGPLRWKCNFPAFLGHKTRNKQVTLGFSIRSIPIIYLFPNAASLSVKLIVARLSNFIFSETLCSVWNILRAGDSHEDLSPNVLSGSVQPAH